MCKNAKLHNFWSHLHLLAFGPPYFRLQHKILKLGSRLFLGLLRGFQSGCPNLIAQKLTKKIGSLEMDFCQTRDLVVDPWVRSPTQLYNFCCLLTVKIWPRFNLPVKRYSIYAHRQTHRQTDRHTFCIPIGGDEIFLHMEIYTCHFSMFIRSLCSLIHFVCEGYFKIFM